MSEPRYEVPVAPPQNPTKSLLEQMQELLASVNADLADLAELGADLGPARGAGLGLAQPELRGDREPAGGASADW
ncbi:hypothetical protein [Kitasatospora sp. LaBMicrA B282]|uniref:hypothetical protein n=1 Tax=Kitasatospora sp. LaBMicrA B282 TaxID=3420949 RepID=UPI003D14D6C5